MRVARLALYGQELCAIEHRGALYRVDRLDAILGAPLPSGTATFQRRVIALGLGTLRDHVEALEEGTRLDDATVHVPPAQILPPTSTSPRVRDVTAQSTELCAPVPGRVLAHDTIGLLPRGAGPLVVAGAVALVIADDLHLPTEAEARHAILGMTLGIAWSLAADEQTAIAAGLGPMAARDVGTHLGPWLTEIDGAEHALDLRAGSRSLHTRLSLAEDRVARIVARAGRFEDVHAGDVFVFVSPDRLSVEAGEDVTVSSVELGTLRGRIGAAAR